MKIPSIIHPSWHEYLSHHFTEESNLTRFKNQVLPLTTYYPEKKNIFRVFEMPISNIKLVVIGQDPYPSVGDAIGYAFATGNKKKPASFRIIEEELGHSIPNDLHTWREQGVFLLNTALTVINKQPGSHIPYWRKFTIDVIETISNQNPCAWLLMGKYAQSYIEFIKQGNLIFKVPHPAAEVYSGKRAGFIGSGIFNLINDKTSLSL